MDTVREKAVQKWREICMESDCVESETLRCKEAREELTADGKRKLLKEFGEDEYVWCDDKGRIFAKSDKALIYVPTRGMLFLFRNLEMPEDGMGKIRYSAMEYDWKTAEPGNDEFLGKGAVTDGTYEYVRGKGYNWQEYIMDILKKEFQLTNYDCLPTIVLDNGKD